MIAPSSLRHLRVVQAQPISGPKGQRSSWGERLKATPEVAWVVLVFVLVIGGILKGFSPPRRRGA